MRWLLSCKRKCGPFNPPSESSVYRQTWSLVSYGHMHARPANCAHTLKFLSLHTHCVHRTSLALAEALNQIHWVTKHQPGRIWTPHKGQQLTQLVESQSCTHNKTHIESKHTSIIRHYELTWCNWTAFDCARRHSRSNVTADSNQLVQWAYSILGYAIPTSTQ